MARRLPPWAAGNHPTRNRVGCWGLVLCSALCLLAGCGATDIAEARIDGSRSITDRRVEWPAWSTWWRVIRMQDYNTRVVVLGTTLLGLAAGTIGSFTLLRKRALMGDALSHATLPGIALAFMIASGLGYPGKSLPILLAGAAVTGVLGMGTIVLIRNGTRLKEDAALGIVLSVFFGGGVALLAIAQRTGVGNAAGLEGFIYGKTASMVASDAWLIAAGGGISTLLVLLLFKELKLLCFDETFAGSQGFPVVVLDLALMVAVVIVTIIGLQAVGLILMIALLVIPAAAARFWTERMTRMTAIAAGIGAVSCMIGSAMSAIFPRLPSGAMIVLVSAAIFLASMVLGRRRGVLIRYLRRCRMNQKIDRQHLLRGIYEILEARGATPASPLAADQQATGDGTAAIRVAELLKLRSWSAARLRRGIRRAVREGLVVRGGNATLRLTAAGQARAQQWVREHRLWEMYLITHADVAPSRVDRDVDAIEHVLDAAMISELQSLVDADVGEQGVPACPHSTAAAAPESPARGA